MFSVSLFSFSILSKNRRMSFDGLINKDMHTPKPSANCCNFSRYHLWHGKKMLENIVLGQKIIFLSNLEIRGWIRRLERY